ncbi:Exosome component 10 [Quaeritorhiza haematococci]|nr:Exosome component 10 [Quaeritorhiza haematococci]
MDNIQEYSGTLFNALVQLTKATANLNPSDLPFYKSTSSSFGKELPKTAQQILGLCNDLLLYTDVEAGGSASIDTHNAPFYEDVDDVTDNFDGVVDVLDNLLEKTDVCLDEITGRKRKEDSTVFSQSAPMLIVQQAGAGNSERKYIHAHNILRPQLKFEDRLDNGNTPFVRKITYKPNALQPLDYGLPGSADISSEMSQHIKTLGITDATSSSFRLPHPYDYEIRNIVYPDQLFEIKPEIPYAPLEQTPCTWVDDVKTLDNMLKVLESATEIAVDLEHHDYRSFQGFTCLIQISTREEDFIVDALELRSHLHKLNETFTNPQIVKVFHGAEMDIQWLQRDFGVYIVNLFDTYHASCVMELSKHSYAFLLQHYCDVHTDKKYQLADWRIRPLTNEMLRYARMDTHYLLYIYDKMRNEILSRSDPVTHNLLRVTLQRSEQTALRQYEKEIYRMDGDGPGGWMTTLSKYGRPLNTEQVAVFRAVHGWRDHIARQEDESTRYVLPNHMLFTIADQMPTDPPGILGCCRPVPPLVRMYTTELATLIERARLEARERLKAKSQITSSVSGSVDVEGPEGSTHIRFDAQVVVKSDGSADTSKPAAVKRRHPPGTKPTPRVPLRAVLIVHKTQPCGYLNLDDDDEAEERARKKELEAAQRKAAEVRKGLVLVPPVHLLSRRKGKEKVPTPSSSPLNEASSNKSVDDSGSTATKMPIPLASRKHRASDEVEDISPASSPTKKPRLSAGDDVEPRARQQQQQVEVRAFDYGNTKSSVASMMERVIKNPDDSRLTGIERSIQKQTSKEPKFDKGPRINVNAKSGNRSFSYKK